jgi:hypothetical protein
MFSGVSTNINSSVRNTLCALQWRDPITPTKTYAGSESLNPLPTLTESLGHSDANLIVLSERIRLKTTHAVECPLPPSRLFE